MPRKSHKKSRVGCSRCKRRHLKCDETRPTCVNCITAHLTCPYEAERLPESGNPVADRLASTASNLTLMRRPAATSPTPYSAESNTDSPLNLLHLELLHWWSTGLRKRVFDSLEVPEVYADTCVKYGLRFPFLIRQILATSALNLSIVRPEQRDFYHHHAVQLQSEALAGFNSILERLDESNILPAFLCSSMVGQHFFCETLFYRNSDFNASLDALIECINLLRGVRTVIGPWWTFLLESEISSVLHLAQYRREKSIADDYHLGQLEELINNADVSDASRQTYRETITELGRMFSMQCDLTEVEAAQSANMIFAWLVVVPKEYVELISARRPEALIILSYYGVVLHHRRAFWAIGDGGKFLVDSINSHLGKHWDRWLAWPRSRVSVEGAGNLT